MKNFSEWMKTKEALDSKTTQAPHVSEGQIWWASLGENIGYEINGKNKMFMRPVLIFKKLSAKFYLIIPLTTKQHTGSWYVNYNQQNTSEGLA